MPRNKKYSHFNETHTVFKVYIDGAGMRPDGTGSAYAYFNQTTGKRSVRYVDGLTNNQAEYRGLIFALRNLPVGSVADIFTDSQLLHRQYNQEWNVNDVDLQNLLDRAVEIIRERHLTVTLHWVGRKANLAGPILERKPRKKR